MENWDGNRPLECQTQRPSLYQRAARFTAESPARQPSLATERVIAASDTDISAFRFRLNRVWHVSAVASIAPDRVLQ
jgi:hypothetical protein